MFVIVCATGALDVPLNKTMSKGTRKLQVNRQQKNILLLALFILKHKIKKHDPESKQVLNFIKFQKLIIITEADLVLVSKSQLTWENNFAWRRQDLKEEGALTMPQRGIWKITEHGEDLVLVWASILHYFTEVNDNWEDKLDGLREIFGEDKVIITSNTIRLAEEAYRIALDKMPNRLPLLTDEMKGKIRL